MGIEITDEMKAACMGEFSVEVTHECSSCFYNGGLSGCKVCGGEITYKQHHTIPWTTIKDIYKMMREASKIDAGA